MVHNEHVRELGVDRAAVGRLLETLASDDDLLWPRRWPPIRLDRGLEVGSTGGHGPIPYHVIEHVAGERVVLGFGDEIGLAGSHRLEVRQGDGGTVVLAHVLTGEPRGWMRMQWPLLIRPLHDALIEDLLDRAERELSVGPANPAQWSLRVRLLRWTATSRPAASTRAIAAGSAVVTLGAAAALHAAWAAGATWPAADQQGLAELVAGSETFPPAFLTAVVAGLLAAASATVAGRQGWLRALDKGRLDRLWRVGTGGVMGVLAVRGVAGLTISALGSGPAPYRTWDLRLYSPLCLALAAATALVLSRPPAAPAG